MRSIQKAPLSSERQPVLQAGSSGSVDEVAFGPEQTPGKSHYVLNNERFYGMKQKGHRLRIFQSHSTAERRTLERRLRVCLRSDVQNPMHIGGVFTKRHDDMLLWQMESWKRVIRWKSDFRELPRNFHDTIKFSSNMLTHGEGGDGEERVFAAKVCLPSRCGSVQS